MEKTMGSGRVTASIYQSRGARHRQEGMPSEDALLVSETAKLLFYGLADGRSGACRGREGGIACLKRLEAFIRSRGICELARMPFPDEVPYILMGELRRCLLELSRAQQMPFEAYSSTLLVLAIDPNTMEYVVIHLGDGCIIGSGPEAQARVLSGPENGLSRRHTWFTTGKSAIAHLRVTFGSVNGLNRLLLMTDGVSRLCCGGHIPARAIPHIAKDSQKALIEYLEKYAPEDDAACLVLDFS